MPMNVLLYHAGSPLALSCAAELAADGAEVRCLSESVHPLPEEIVQSCADPLSPAALSEAVARLCGEKALDLLILSSGLHAPDDGAVTSGSRHDCDALLGTAMKNVGGVFSVLTAALPCLEAGRARRIALLYDENPAISCQTDCGEYAFHMSEAALGMMQKLFFNRLRPAGFTFRSFVGGAGGMSAKEYILGDFCYDPEEPYIHSEENRLVTRDGLLRELPW